MILHVVCQSIMDDAYTGIGLQTSLLSRYGFLQSVGHLACTSSVKASSSWIAMSDNHRDF